MNELYIGLMSGTSVDGIDAALVDFSDKTPRIIAFHYTPYSNSLREKILQLCVSGENEIMRLGEMDVLLGKAFAQASHELLQKAQKTPADIRAIGSHGQTIRHHPNIFTLQIADPNTIAAETGITTIADFRRKDMARGGQGAPLVPAFHQHIFHAAHINRAIVNIGGIANITALASDINIPVIGFDTGPGNGLLDAWIKLNENQPYDANGDFARQGKINERLLHRLLSDPFFHQAPPKSTGREYFNLMWLQQKLTGFTLSASDVQATLTELTAQSIMNEVRHCFIKAEVLVCGGGTKNQYLMERLTELATPHFKVTNTNEYGIDADSVEAVAFAWLAKQTLHQQPGNLPSVTGANKAVILGGIYHS